MIFALELGPQYQQAVSDLSEAGANLRAAVGAGLAEGVQLSAAHVTENYLSGQYLKRRTGALAKAVQGWIVGKDHGVVGVAAGSGVEKYKYLLGDETVVIRPKKAKYLAIPIGEALTSTGAVKGQYAQGPRSVEGGFFIRSKSGQLLFGYKVGQRGKFRPLYVLKKKVTIFGTGALTDGVEES
ncbi:MAG: hypothetical protein DRP56_04930, partial [Planctomycetota bacterium]